ncbi:hypothetical protein JL36_08575 [Lactococcus cremoris]|nr:hypothetical protein JL36_08575 [Lactococcus cremoris]
MEGLAKRLKAATVIRSSGSGFESLLICFIYLSASIKGSKWSPKTFGWVQFLLARVIVCGGWLKWLTTSWALATRGFRFPSSPILLGYSQAEGKDFGLPHALVESAPQLLCFAEVRIADAPDSKNSGSFTGVPVRPGFRIT